MARLINARQRRHSELLNPGESPEWPLHSDALPPRPVHKAAQVMPQQANLNDRADRARRAIEGHSRQLFFHAVTSGGTDVELVVSPGEGDAGGRRRRARCPRQRRQAGGWSPAASQEEESGCLT
jgi:hypothetical protein